MAIAAEEWPMILGNAITVLPTDDLQTKYNWLKSSARDAVMGPLSATNRRALLLAPGLYALTSQFTLDTNYVDLIGLGCPTDACLTRETGGTCVKQTANDTHLSNFTIQTTGIANGQLTGGDRGLEIAAADNTPSSYIDMHFLGTSSVNKQGFPVFGTSDMSGFWNRCHAGGHAWRVDIGKKLKATMYNCVSWYQTIGVFDPANGYGYSSFGGDALGAEISGRLIRCVAGIMSFGGCGQNGCDCSGYFEECRSGANSFATWRHFSGIALRCTAGFNSFASGAEIAGGAAKFSGICIDCIVSGKGSAGIELLTEDENKCFGMGPSGSLGLADNAKIINCRYGYYHESQLGVTRAATPQVLGTGAFAALTTNFAAGINANIILTAKLKGKKWNSASFRIVQGVEKGADLWSCSIVSDNIQVNYGINLAGTKTGTDLKNLLETNADITSVVTVALAGNGTALIDNSYSVQYLSGGADVPLIFGCHPSNPTHCPTDYTVKRFDNGHTYTNLGASAPIIFTLPPAVSGIAYTFAKALQQNLTINPNGSDTIDGGTSVANTAAESGKLITLKCFEDGKWITVYKTGAWS